MLKRKVFALAGALIAAAPGLALAQTGAITLSPSKSALALRAGATMALPLSEPAQKVTVSNAAAATAHISGDRIAVIKGRAPGSVRISIQNAQGKVTNAFDVVVRDASPEATGSLGREPLRADMTPSRIDLLTLMGPDFSLHEKPKARTASFGRLPRGPALLSAGPTRPPIGWQQFCSLHADECAVPSIDAQAATLDAERWAQLADINDRVNRRVKPMSDQKHHGVPEYWSYPMDGFGDCEDYVLLKRRLLIEAGWPRQALLVTVVRDQNNEGHAVLTVRTSANGDLVLDNQRARILNWSDTGYRYVKRQSAENPNLWVNLRDLESRIEAALQP